MRRIGLRGWKEHFLSIMGKKQPCFFLGPFTAVAHVFSRSLRYSLRFWEYTWVYRKCVRVSMRILSYSSALCLIIWCCQYPHICHVHDSIEQVKLSGTRGWASVAPAKYFHPWFICRAHGGFREWNRTDGSIFNLWALVGKFPQQDEERRWYPCVMEMRQPDISFSNPWGQEWVGSTTESLWERRFCFCPLPDRGRRKCTGYDNQAFLYFFVSNTPRS